MSGRALATARARLKGVWATCLWRVSGNAEREGFAPQLCTSCALRHSAIHGARPLPRIHRPPLSAFHSRPRHPATTACTIRLFPCLQPKPISQRMGCERPCTRNSACTAEMGLGCKQYGIAGWNAEREGFEPSVGCPTHAFQACTIGHSDTSPDGKPESAGDTSRSMKTGGLGQATRASTITHASMRY